MIGEQLPSTLLPTLKKQDAVMFCIVDGVWAFDFYAGREHKLARTVAMPAVLYLLSYDAAVVEKRV
jgi:hypothetical protein